MSTAKNILEKMCQFFDEKYVGEEKALLIDAINDFCNEEDVDFHYEYDENTNTADFLDVEGLDVDGEIDED